ncbi:MAG TPA: hypothetical protein PKW03_02680 [Acetivibrio sp.]|nr:hypothetical protein [Clostridium sp.]HOQ36774.1 hypothetical protein [Acetivibrio sp.]HPT90445.1 hypothetical protein [Acetivibrio sp.]
MQDMSFLKFLLVSFPEQLLFIFLGSFAIGKYSYFKTRSNYFRFLAVCSLMVVISYLLKEKLGLGAESTLLILFSYIILIIFIMKFKFYESIAASIFAFSLLLLIEIPVSVIIGSILEVENSNGFMENPVHYYTTFFVIRLLQSILALIFYRFKFKIINMEYPNNMVNEYYVQLFVYLIAICTLGFLTFLMARMLLIDTNSTIPPQNTYLLRLNIYITIFVTIILTRAVKSVYTFYKNKNTLNNNEVIQNLDYVQGLLKEQNYNEAIEALSALKEHILDQ